MSCLVVPRHTTANTTTTTHPDTLTQQTKQTHQARRSGARMWRRPSRASPTACTCARYAPDLGLANSINRMAVCACHARERMHATTTPLKPKQHKHTNAFKTTADGARGLRGGLRPPRLPPPQRTCIRVSTCFYGDVCVCVPVWLRASQSVCESVALSASAHRQSPTNQPIHP